MNILIATGGSKHAFDALESSVARLAWFRDAPSVELVHLLPPIGHGRAAARRSIQRDFANGHISASVLSRITWWCHSAAAA
jgi:hypothetical protein